MKRSLYTTAQNDEVGGNTGSSGHGGGVASGAADSIAVSPKELLYKVAVMIFTLFFYVKIKSENLSTVWFR